MAELGCAAVYKTSPSFPVFNAQNCGKSTVTVVLKTTVARWLDWSCRW